MHDECPQSMENLHGPLSILSIMVGSFRWVSSFGASSSGAVAVDSRVDVVYVNTEHAADIRELPICVEMKRNSSSYSVSEFLHCRH
jgi:hypothetical protein